VEAFWKLQKLRKFVDGRVSAPHPAGEAYTAPSDPLVGWEAPLRVRPARKNKSRRLCRIILLGRIVVLRT